MKWPRLPAALNPEPEMSFSPFSTAPALEPVANGITERRTPTTFDVRMGKGLGATAIHPNSSAKYKKNFFVS